ncbi:MAG TPA: MFS transporter [Candidatus Dormibacteraeota bacterium]|nr:MFS transporter [Candidatus Dormibacteraeota bacterium]
MTPQTALLAALIGFVGGMGGMGLTQLLLAGRARRHGQRSRARGERRRRLRPSVERLLRTAIRFERYTSRWSPAWRPDLSDDARERARELADQLDEDTEMAEVALRLEDAHGLAGVLGELRTRLARFRLLVEPAPPGADPSARLAELGAVAAAVTASLPDLKAAVLAELQGSATTAGAAAPVPAPAPPLARVPAAPAAASGRRWLDALDPLRDTVFRWLWLASLAAQLGTWIQNVGAVDLMTTLAPTALLLALVQTATSLPGLALALPAGALADIVDRRRLLLAASAWMCGVSALLTVTAFAHLATWWSLLALTFALGVGTVAGLPAWQAIIPDLVSRERLAPAVTLSSVAINLARAIGPAVGGLAVALAGPGAAFALTASAFAFTALVVLGWRREEPAASLPAEGVGAAMWSGLRYSLLAAPVRAILVRAAGFIAFASALWALLPVVARQVEGAFAGYGGLLGALGVGAVVGALALTAIRRRVGPDALTFLATLLFSAVALALGFASSYWLALGLMLGAGVSWVCAISTFNVSAQRAAPRWVRGRVLASYQVAYMGSMAVGSAAWGAVADRLGAGPTLAGAAILMVAAAALSLRWRLDLADPLAGEPATPLTPALPAGSPGPVASLRPRALGVGTVMDRRMGAYRLETAIGEGALGVVYVGRHEALEVQRAVKVMRTDLAADPRLRDAFLRGAAVAARLRHPSVVTVYDCAYEGDVPYLVMEYVDSTTLEEHLGRLPAPERVADPGIRRCVRDIAAALDHAHAAGVVHGDLKPANVLLRLRDGQALVGDFAVAPAGAGRAAAGHDPFRAPERWDGAPEPTPAADVYAFAAILYLIVTGERPYSPGLAAIAGHPDRPAPPLGLTAPGLPPKLDAVLARGLATSPPLRHRTAGELATAFLEATESAALPALRAPAALAPAPSAASGMRRNPTGRMVAPAAVVLVGAVLLALGGTPAAEGRGGLPAPVVGVLGEPVTVAGLRLTVLSVELDAQPPAGFQLDDGERYVLVQVLYQPGDGGVGITSPYDWSLTDASGASYGAYQYGIGGALPEGRLGANQSARGLLAFIVPRTARGLVLQYDAEVGDGSARIPLS